MVAGWPEFGEQIFRTLQARRAWHEEKGYGVLRLIAPQSSRRSFEVRDLLERNLFPVRWYDVDTDPESDEMLKWLEIPREETPILLHARTVLRNPSPAQVARELGLRAEVDGQRFDLVVLGAGPAGLAAAVYGGSEGLRTLVVESWAPGGQAGTSTRIENYLGFPTGVSGRELTTKATLQARRFDATLSSYHRAVELADGPEGLVRIDLDDGQHVLARSLVMATGARWRELQAAGVDRFRGAGVYHAAMPSEVERSRDKDIVVIGGGNSAGQAAVSLSQKARSVRVIVRGAALKTTMSSYLVERIERSPRIEVLTETEVVEIKGSAVVESVTLEGPDGSRHDVDTSAVYVMIGADPCTEVSATGCWRSTTRASCSAATARTSASATSPGRCPTASRRCWRRCARASSPRATCGRERRTGSPARSATAPSSSASPTSCSATTPRRTSPRPAERGDDAAPSAFRRELSAGLPGLVEQFEALANRGEVERLGLRAELLRG